MESKYQYEFTEQATNDLDAILHYIITELGNSTAASKFMERLEKGIKEACDFPKSGALTENEYLPEIEIREKYIGHYTMYYMTDSPGEKIIVIRLVYSGRDSAEVMKEIEL